MLWLNPEAHVDTHTHTSGSLSAAALKLNWLQRRGSSTAFPPGVTQSANAAAAATATAVAAAAGLPSLRLMNLGVTLLPRLMSVSRSMSCSQNESYAKLK